MPNSHYINRVLTIAGSDSGGGAGIQADLKTITLLGGFGMSVVTALTAQNTQEVRAIHAPPSSFVKAQLDAVLSDIGVDAVKTGMLYDEAIIHTVAEGLSAYHVDTVVVDPVMVAKGGDRLLVERAVQALKDSLIPRAYVLTPNIPEAEVLTDAKIYSDEDVRKAAKKLHAFGAAHVIIKGGHLDGPATDTLFDGDRFQEYSRQRVTTAHTHGTGCVFSAALATFLGAGLHVKSAVEKAKGFIHDAIRFAVPLGKGHGPTNLYASFAREQARYRVLEDLETEAARLAQSTTGHLVPDVHSNLAYALPFAQTSDDVAAFPEHLVRLHEKMVPLRGPRFGVSQHHAAIVLTVMEYDPAFRSAMNIRFSESRLKQCDALGWDVRSFDRSMAPKEMEENESRIWVWGTKSALSVQGKIPDMIYHSGGAHIEPMMWVIGKSPQEVVDKVLHL